MMRQVRTSLSCSQALRKIWCSSSLNFKCSSTYIFLQIGEQYNTYDSLFACYSNFWNLTSPTTVLLSLIPNPQLTIRFDPLMLTRVMQLPNTSYSTQLVKNITPNLLMIPLFIVLPYLASQIQQMSYNFLRESGEWPSIMMRLALQGRICVMVLMWVRVGGLCYRLIMCVMLWVIVGFLLQLIRLQLYTLSWEEEEGNRLAMSYQFAINRLILNEGQMSHNLL